MSNSPRDRFTDTESDNSDEAFIACTSNPIDDAACSKENNSRVINGGLSIAGTSTLGGSTRSTLASTVSGLSNPFSLSEKPPQLR